MANRRYDESYKKEAMRLVIEEGQRIRAVERSMGITFVVLKGWIAKYHNQQKSAPTESPEKKIRLIEKQIAQLTRECEILKKVATFISEKPEPHSGS